MGEQEDGVDRRKHAKTNGKARVGVNLVLMVRDLGSEDIGQEWIYSRPAGNGAETIAATGVDFAGAQSVTQARGKRLILGRKVCKEGVERRRSLLLEGCALLTELVAPSFNILAPSLLEFDAKVKEWTCPPDCCPVSFKDPHESDLEGL
jgi:hypothetical protein